MKTVNLLPQWYLEAALRRRRTYRQLWSIVLVGVLVAGWAGMDRRQVLALQDKSMRLDRQTAPFRQLADQLRRRHEELHRLQTLQTTYRELGSTVPMSAVVQQILNDMTPGMALSQITIDVQRDPIKTDGRIVSDPHRPPRFHEVAHIDITGIAPDSMLIAQLIGKLSGNPLFEDVSLNFSRSELLHDYDVRRFDVLLNMDLDRVTGQQPRSALQAWTGDSNHAG